LLEQVQIHAVYGAIAMRLAKFLANAGVASRRAAEEIVRSGRVNVDGATITDPARPVTSDQAVAVDGDLVREPLSRVVYAVNKPYGVVSTARDPQQRPTVVDLVESELRLYPVGRLDVDTTGLILLTNDGTLAHRLTHPSFEVPKTYRAVVGNPPVRAAALRCLRQGVTLEDGVTAPARARRLAPDTIELTLHEGRKHQVKRMCAEVGHPVRELQRTRFGSLELGELPRGAYRRLAPTELDSLMTSAGAARRGEASSSSARPRPPAASTSRDGSSSSAGS
jgi:23S rRNA pseudouridine2605 synthase